MTISPTHSDVSVETLQRQSFLRFREQLADSVRERLQGLLENLYKLKIIQFWPRVSVEIPKYQADSEEQHRAVLTAGGTLEETIMLDLSLSKQDTDRRKWPLGTVPWLTRTGSLVVRGRERFMMMQLRRAPGLFLSVEEVKRRGKEGTDLVQRAVAELKPEKGVHLRLVRELAPDSGKNTRVVIGRQSMPLAIFVKALGTEEFSNGMAQQLRRLAQSLVARSGGGAEPRDPRQQVRDALFSSRLGVLGRWHLNGRLRRLDGFEDYNESVMTLTEKDFQGITMVLDALVAGQLPVDDPFNLANLRVYRIGDFLTDALDQWIGWLAATLRQEFKPHDQPVSEKACWKLLVSSNRLSQGDTRFSAAMRRWTSESPLCQSVADGNSMPISVAALSRRITLGGPGGMAPSAKREPRDLHWSHIGRVCPLDTPIGDDVGVTLSLTHSARISEEGLVQAHYRKISRNGDGFELGTDDLFLSVLDEVDGMDVASETEGWIAYPDQLDALLKGREVSVHRGPTLFARVPVAEVSWIHPENSDLYSLVANLLPYRCHNHPIRSTMACNMLRQALTLENATAPRVKTEFETLVASFGPEILLQATGELLYGTELWIGYLPWYGWNFEDALVISESAAKQLTSVHPYRKRIELLRSLTDHQIAYELMGLNTEEWRRLGIDPRKYNEMGILRVGEAVTPDTPLVLEPAPKTRPDGSFNRFVKQHRCMCTGKVVGIALADIQVGEVELGVVEITLAGSLLKPAVLGDKLANRHGHKGVISRILPDPEMPYIRLDPETPVVGDKPCPCGESYSHQHLQVLINPLSVVSRMNIGQFRELAEREGSIGRLDCFDPCSVVASERVAMPSKVLAGRQYMLKLNQNAADKLNARSRVPDSYSTFVEQPLRGRRLKGGQRVGEMETWALMAHQAPALLREMMTLKSDNPKPRALLYQQLLEGGSATLQGAQLPEALRTFAAYCSGLGLKLTLVDKQEKEHDPLRLDCAPEEVVRLVIAVLDQQEFLKNASQGEVSTPQVAAPQEVGYEYHREGLESEAIFGPTKSFTCACGKYQRKSKTTTGGGECEVCGTPLIPNYHRRLRLGHIRLVRPVVNPYLLLGLEHHQPFHEMLGKSFGLSFDAARAMSAERFALNFVSWEQALRFIEKVVNVSSGVCAALEHATGKEICLANTAESPSSLGQALPEESRKDLQSLKDHYRQSHPSVTPSELVSEKMSELGKKTGYKQFGPWLNKVFDDERLSALDLLADLFRSDRQTQSLVLDAIVVIPPDLRRKLKLSSGFWRSHDLMVLYKGVLKANAKLAEVAPAMSGTTEPARSRSVGASLPERSDQSLAEGAAASASEPNNEYRNRRSVLQRTVARLMCNHRIPNPMRAVDWHSPGWPKRVRDSLASFLEGKQGLLIGHLLGKRVDYSARAVITLDPSLPMDECRLPFVLAVRLLEPLLLWKLGEMGKKTPLNQLKDQLAAALQGKPDDRKQVFAAANALLRDRPVLLNRQPTLHRLGLLAFRAQVGEGDVIAIPAQVTAGFNADFDGDQMAVYLPVTEEARAEVERLLPSRNLWHPANGRFVPGLAQDLALGGYLMCHVHKGTRARNFESGPSDQEIAMRSDKFVAQAFQCATRSGFSFGLDDLEALRQAAEGTSGDKDAMRAAVEAQGKDEPFRRMLDSGARGDWATLIELAGGERPEQQGSNLTGGLSDSALLQRCVTGRRNLVDTKLGTAEGGWLTKVLVHHAQGLRVSRADCGDGEGLTVSIRQSVWLFLGETPRGGAAGALAAHRRERVKITGLLWDVNGDKKSFDVQALGEEVTDCNLEGMLTAVLAEHPARKPPRLVAVRIERLLGDSPEQRLGLLFQRLYGRKLALALPDRGLPVGAALDQVTAKRIADWLAADHGDGTMRVVRVRSPMVCKEPEGVCAACYGLPWWRGRVSSRWDDEDLLAPSAPVGIIAAQAIGEPGTQLALRKKHLAGTEADDAASLVTINSIMGFLDAILTGKLKPEEIRETFDYLYQSNELDIAPIHYETIVRGMGSPSGWVARLAHATEPHFQEELVRAAWLGESDPLNGLKERLILGADVFGDDRRT